MSWVTSFSGHKSGKKIDHKTLESHMLLIVFAHLYIENNIIEMALQLQ